MPWQFRNDLPHLHPAHRPDPAEDRQRRPAAGGALALGPGPGRRGGVNPNTMRRAMMEMEREELVHSQRTAGRFVTEDGERIRRLQGVPGPGPGERLLEGMFQLGFQLEEILTFVQTEGEKQREHSGE